MYYLMLLLAIVCETAGTTLLKFSEQFTRVVPTVASLICYVASLICYVASLYFLSVCLKVIPIAVAYAIWSALGVALITIIGIVAFKQVPDIGAYIGLLLIVSGVVVLNLFSKMDVH